MGVVKRLVRRPSPALLGLLAALVVAVGCSATALASVSPSGPSGATHKKHRHHGRRGPRGKTGPRGIPGPQGPAGLQGPPGKGTAFLFRKNGTYQNEVIISVAGLVLEAACNSGALSVQARPTEDHSIIHLTSFSGPNTVLNQFDDDFTKSDPHIDLGTNNQGLFDYVSPGGQVLQVTYVTVSGGTIDNCVFAGYYSIG